MGEVSPTFSSVAEMVDWARLRTREVVVVVRITIYWEGPGDTPTDAMPLNVVAVQADFQDFLNHPRNQDQKQSPPPKESELASLRRGQFATTMAAPAN
jgi:hypothetical protein